MLRRTTTHAQCSEICQINDNLLITHQQPCICPLSVLHSSAHNHSPCQHAGPKMVLTYVANNSLTYHDSRPTLITTLFNLSFSFCVQLISIVLHCLAMTRTINKYSITLPSNDTSPNIGGDYGATRSPEFQCYKPPPMGSMLMSQGFTLTYPCQRVTDLQQALH